MMSRQKVKENDVKVKLSLNRTEKSILAAVLCFVLFAFGYLVGNSSHGAVISLSENDSIPSYTTVSEAESEVSSDALSESGDESDVGAVSEVKSEDGASVEAETEQETSNGLININTADVEELSTLPGIGEILASRIVAFREENGNFKTVYDLVDVYGIGETKLNAMLEYITVG